MTEKRLIVDDCYNWIDTKTDAIIDVEDAFDLVNELSEENEQLKQSNKRYKCINKQLEDRLGNSLALDMGECE